MVKVKRHFSSLNFNSFASQETAGKDREGEYFVRHCSTVSVARKRRLVTPASCTERPGNILRRRFLTCRALLVSLHSSLSSPKNGVACRQALCGVHNWTFTCRSGFVSSVVYYSRSFPLPTLRAHVWNIELCPSLWMHVFVASYRSWDRIKK